MADVDHESDPDRDATERRRRPLGAAYWRLWTASGLSNLADGIFKVALPLVAIRITRSPALIAGLTFAVTLPWLLFALPAGALADRLDRRTAMLSANVVRGGLLAVLALSVLFDRGSIWTLYVVAFCVGTAETLYDTAAQSILPQVVSREQLSRANARLYAVEMSANEFVGPPLSGVLMAVGAAVALGTPAALWALAVAALVLLRGRFRIDRDRQASLRADIAEGLRFLFNDRVLRALAVMVGISNFAQNATWALLVLYAVGQGSAMGLTEPAFGLLLASTAAGGLAGSLVADKVERRLGRARALVGATAGSALLGAPALTTSPFVMGACFFVGGAAIVVWNVIGVSLRQTITPDRLLGRVNSGFRLVAWGSIPLGAATAGLLANYLGLRAVFVLMLLVRLALIGAMTFVTDEKLDAAEGKARGAA